MSTKSLPSSNTSESNSDGIGHTGILVLLIVVGLFVIGYGLFMNHKMNKQHAEMLDESQKAIQAARELASDASHQPPAPAK